LFLKFVICFALNCLTFSEMSSIITKTHFSPCHSISYSLTSKL
jgi:hypothetical protein